MVSQATDSDGLQTFRTPHDFADRACAFVGGLEPSASQRAVVKWFNRLRGFGFLTRGPETADIFVHMETLRRCGFIELRPGQTVLVRYGNGPSGLSAAELKPDCASGPSSH